MPLQKIEKNQGCPWGLWKIDEKERVTLKDTFLGEKVPDVLTHPKKQLEWYAGRHLIKQLVEHCGLTFHGIIKDIHGKPFLRDSTWQLSLSHSYPYVVAYLHRSQPVGIDLEQPKEKLLSIGRRVLAATELTDAAQNVTKHCVYWCAKEALLKIHGKKDLIFAKNLKISPFSLFSAGEIIGKIIVNSTETIVPLYYQVNPDFVVVLNKP